MNIIEFTTKIKNGKIRTYNDYFGVGTAISGIANAIATGAQNEVNKEIAEANLAEQKRQYAENMAFQREQYEYQKKLNDLQMQREDTAVQRNAADLEAAGFNKLLAAGGTGSATGSYSSTAFTGTEAAQNQYVADFSGIGQGIGQIASGIEGAVYQAMSFKNQMANDQANRNLQAKQGDYYDALALDIIEQKAGREGERGLTKAQRDYYEKLRDSIAHDLGVRETWGIASGQNIDERIITAQAIITRFAPLLEQASKISKGDIEEAKEVVKKYGKDSDLFKDIDFDKAAKEGRTTQEIGKLISAIFKWATNSSIQ